MTGRRAYVLLAAGVLGACAAPPSRQGTLAELEALPADVDEVYVADSLERAAASYRRFLEETPESARTPEAMRRLADLQIEQAYGVIGQEDLVEMAAPQAGAVVAPAAAAPARSASAGTGETDAEFEARATARATLLADTGESGLALTGVDGEPIPAGPREAIRTYREILERYPDYERNDKVLYQMSRAYDEIGQPDEAMAVMDRLVAEYPYSRYVDEVYFRRGEYYFVRKRYLDAEDAYKAIVAMGPTTEYYELGLYKLGWAFYKQELYEEALDSYTAMLDHRLSIGFDFDIDYEAEEEHRVADTFRVISLSFSNLGGPEVIDEYFSANGHRQYADKVYGNLGEFYFDKLRFEDAASVYRSFVDLNPWHEVAPGFSMRIVEIYAEAGFPLLVVKAKKEFATRYALDADYWRYFDVADRPEVLGFLKTNLTDLAGHYHALYQADELVDERPRNFAEASRWYRQFLASFPADEETPATHYRLGDLLLENEDFGTAAVEYEQTAYGYGTHEQSAAAGYAAVYAWRQHLDRVTGAEKLEVKRSTVESSLKFADAFPGHEEAPEVLGAAADDLYEMQEFAVAIASAMKLIERYPDAEPGLRRAAWAVVGHSSMDLAEYTDAEHAYANLLNLTPADDESRQAVVDGLAAAIYKQGEQANLLEDYRVAADHFLRIKDLAPTSKIRANAEYDAAAALMRLEDWGSASSVLEEFRTSHADNELSPEATKQLAYIYRESGQLDRSAAEHERIAAEAEDPELAREALLTAGELYDEAGSMDDAVRVYQRYVSEHPRPLDLAMETRSRLAEIFKEALDYGRYYDELGNIVAADRDAGADRSDRSRLLASKAAFVLAERQFESFADLDLVQPFEQSLAEKQQRMDDAMVAFEDLVAYEVAEVTAAATFYIAEIYLEFSNALLESERPAGLSETELFDYEMVIEEEAFPFEERAIEVHEENFELLAGGIYNPWIQKSLDQLAVMMPGRYAKNEISGGYLASIDHYAYRMPVAAPLGSEQPPDVAAAKPAPAGAAANEPEIMAGQGRD